MNFTQLASAVDIDFSDGTVVAKRHRPHYEVTLGL